MACAERGIHLLVEKPMAAGAEGVRQMIAAASQAGVVLVDALRVALSPGGARR